MCDICGAKEKNTDIIKDYDWLEPNLKKFNINWNYYDVKTKKVRFCQECIQKEVQEIKKDPTTDFWGYTIIGAIGCVIVFFVMNKVEGLKIALISLLVWLILLSIFISFLVNKKRKIDNMPESDISDLAIIKCTEKAGWNLSYDNDDDDIDGDDSIF